MRAAVAMISASPLIAPSEPGTTGMPSDLAASLAVTLSPISEMCAGFGPMKVRPCSSTIEAKVAFSLRKPTPGWMASAPVMVAAERMAGMLR